MPLALEKPRARLYAAGHAISVLGGWLQQIALSWLVFRLTKSVFLLGLTGFMLQIPYLFLGPITGSVVDRFPRLRVLIAIDVALALVAVLLAVMVESGVTDVTYYLAAALMIGVLNAFEMPARQSLLLPIVEDRDLLPSALALSATVFNAGRMIGPAVAGVLLLYLSESWCFVLNALSYAGIILALLAMKLPPQAPLARAQSAAPGYGAALATLRSLPAVRYLLPTLAAIGFFGAPYVHLMPSIVDDFFQGGSGTVGFLMSGAGLGALAAALFLSLQRGSSMQVRFVTVAPLGLAAGVAILAVSRSLVLSFMMLAVIGGSMMLSANSTNVLMQTSVPDALRGRTIGLYAMAFQGTAPLGHLAAGAMAARVGLTATFLFNAVCIAAAAIVMRRRLAADPGALARIGTHAET